MRNLQELGGNGEVQEGGSPVVLGGGLLWQHFAPPLPCRPGKTSGGTQQDMLSLHLLNIFHLLEPCLGRGIIIFKKENPPPSLFLTCKALQEHTPTLLKLALLLGLYKRLSDKD